VKIPKAVVERLDTAKQLSDEDSDAIVTIARAALAALNRPAVAAPPAAPANPAKP
jgi:hypothetical protein